MANPEYLRSFEAVGSAGGDKRLRAILAENPSRQPTKRGQMNLAPFSYPKICGLVGIAIIPPVLLVLRELRQLREELVGIAFKRLRAVRAAEVNILALVFDQCVASISLPLTGHSFGA